jgi:hypothetical protein
MQILILIILAITCLNSYFNKRNISIIIKNQFEMEELLQRILNNEKNK